MQTMCPGVDVAIRVFPSSLSPTGWVEFQSLQEMCQKVLGVELDKREQRSNWNLRPLTAAQVLYAAKDAYVLILLESALRREGWHPENILGGLGDLAFRKWVSSRQRENGRRLL